MDELVKSIISFSWAMSLFGIKQLANTVTPRDPSQGMNRAANAFHSVTRATEEQLGDLMSEAFGYGDRMQRGVIDLAYSILTFDDLTPRRMVKVTVDAMQLSADAFKLLVPGQGTRVLFQEFKNKLQAFDLFEHVDSALQLQSGTHLPLPELVERASALGPYLAVWATEGVGHYYAERFWEQNGAPKSLLRGENVGALPAASMTALHAGMGLSFADRLLQTVSPRSSIFEVRRALKLFVALCKDNSRDGFEGAAYESLGLVARNLYPQMVQIIDQQLAEVYADLIGYFWHGVGRAIYFAPTNSLRCTSSPWRAVEMSEREPPHELGRLNALSGLAWALNLVNIRQPEIMETLLKHHGNRLSESDAFSNGVMSSIIIWRDSTLHDYDITRLHQYEPDPSDPSLVELWNCQVRRSCEDALRYYGVLKEHNCLGSVFCYQSLSELVGRLEAGKRGLQVPSMAQQTQVTYT
jgi:hypothetical protein